MQLCKSVFDTHGCIANLISSGFEPGIIHVKVLRAYGSLQAHIAPKIIQTK